MQVSPLSRTTSREHAQTPNLFGLAFSTGGNEQYNQWLIPAAGARWAHETELRSSLSPASELGDE